MEDQERQTNEEELTEEERAAARGEEPTPESGEGETYEGGPIPRTSSPEEPSE